MIARVFPRRTSATPTGDEYIFIGEPPAFFLPDDITEVHISVVFTWDLPEAERLAKLWKKIAPVKIGGPATGERGGEFVPGMYLKRGCVITSRGCPNRCWFCSVPKREGELRELTVTWGWNVLDDNLLACSDAHTKTVFEMLYRVKHLNHKRVMFTGGLEAKRLKPWHVEWFKKLRPKELFFAYDTPDDFEPLVEASRIFKEAGFGHRSCTCCYVLCGYPGDTLAQAEARCEAVKQLGMTPFAMVYRDGDGSRSPEWIKFQHAWSRPAIIWASNKTEKHLVMAR